MIHICRNAVGMSGLSLLTGALLAFTYSSACAQGIGGGGFGGAGIGGGGFGGTGIGGGGFGGGGFGGGMSGGFGSGSTGSFSFSGGGAAFSGGGAAFSGASGGFNGGYGGSINGMGGVGGMSGFGSTGISPSNLFASYYGNPYALGMNSQTGVGATPLVAFGQPLYGNLTTSAGGYGMTGGLSGLGNLGGMRSNTGAGTTASTPPPFALVLESPPNPPARAFAPTNSVLQQRVVNVLAGSNSLPSRQGILVGVVGDMVILRGQVADDHQRRIAELLIRLTPGVHEVKNEILVR